MLKQHFKHDKYFLTDLIAKGSFGEVYLCQNNQDNIIRAAKLESSKENQKLIQEAFILKQLHVPIIFISIRELNCLLMPIYDTNLLQYKLSINEIMDPYNLFEQLIIQLRNIHNLGFVHRDIKPQNIVLLIDFGLAKRYKTLSGDLMPLQQIPKQFVGTSTYASLSAHLGLNQYPKDDLESLSYTLIHIFNGSLPWKQIHSLSINDKYKQIRFMKLNASSKMNTKGPIFLTELFQYSRKLQFNDSINYDYLLDLIRRSRKELIS